VREVKGSEKILGHQATDQQVVVTFAEPIGADRETSITLGYSAVPKRGLFFRTPEMGYKAEDTHLFTQGEAIDARHWFPCFDSPNEKFTSEVICRAPAGMTVLSNGRLMSEVKDSASGLVAVRWLQDKPHVNYLIALAVGYFQRLEDQYGDLPLAFYTPASQIAHAASSFKDTKDMLAFFEREIGVPYPWAKYYQVCVEDFVVGGMENTSLTILTDRTLHPPEFEELHDSQGLVAHELVHQWFGNLTTCKDWAHLWLNEGFATYYEKLYDAHRDGRDALLYRLYQSAQHIASIPNDTNAIVRRDYRKPDEQFGYLAYPKGAWVLHMLRSQLGEDLFRRCIRTWLERHAYGSVVTEDLNAVIEELSGRSFDPFFDQWVYHAHHPELDVAYSWDERSKLAKLTVRQTQKLSDDVLLFRFPLPLRFHSRAGVVDRQILVTSPAEDFYFPLAEAPAIVRVDPDLTVLARITFNPPSALLDAQLTNSADMLGRLIAVEKLSGRREATDKLKQVLNHDPFYGVRLAASRSLRAIRTDEAWLALRDSTCQDDARVRRQVVSDLASCYREQTYTHLLQLLDQEKNPDIQAVIITALGAYSKPGLDETFLRYLRSCSYRNGLAEAALSALRAQDHSPSVAPVLDVLQTRADEFTTIGFCQGLDTLAWLARHEPNKSPVREFLLLHLEHPKDRVKLAAIAALGVLGDAKAIAPLDTFTALPKDSSERAAAEKAVAALRDTLKPGAELGSLRNEVLTLQQENRDLRKDLQDLKKKYEALPSAVATNLPPPPPPPRKAARRRN
jgi:aminopeptidase N